jgi:ATP adenylyltransferase/5',5'''-P-1,P-4-tetraphosphate phosphorylase II
MINNVIIKDSAIEDLILKNNFADAAKQLLKEQKKSWKQLRDGYESLKKIKTKTFQFDGFTMKLQYNPGRYISTSAKVDVKSINERKCFLCPANLPNEQKGILCEDEYLILGNPFPIFPEHFTIPNINHVPQQIKGNFGLMLKLTKDLSKHYVVLYNGPKCGASAPDHFHFQAGTKNFMPITNDFHQLKNEFGELLVENDEITIYAIDDGIRRIISLESMNSDVLAKNFNKLYDIYSSVSENNEEPMMNIISSYWESIPSEEEEFGWIVLVFLREKHRSSHYFANGDEKILLSAASIDLGGVCITPLEKDFEKTTKDKLTEILSEVSLNKNKFELIKQRVGQTSLPR